MADIPFVLSAKDKTSAGINSAKKNISGMGSAADQLSEKLGTLVTGAAFVALGVKVGQFASTCVKDFGEAERAQLRLQAALGDGAAFDKANDLIDTLARKYSGSKDDIDQVVSALAALGRPVDDIEKITQASVNLANVTGQDLNSSYLLLSDTFTGKLSPKLTKLIPELKDLTDEQLAAGGATDLINEKLQAMSDKLSGGTTQKITNLAEAFNDLKENFGAGFAEIFSPFTDWLTSVIDGMNTAISKARETENALNDTGNGKGTASQDSIVRDMVIKDIVKAFGDNVKKVNSGATDDKVLKVVEWAIGQIKSGGGFSMNDTVARSRFGFSATELAGMGQSIAKEIAKETDKQGYGEVSMVDQWADSFVKIAQYTEQIAAKQAEEAKVGAIPLAVAPTTPGVSAKTYESPIPDEVRNWMMFGSFGGKTEVKKEPEIDWAKSTGNIFSGELLESSGQLAGVFNAVSSAGGPVGIVFWAIEQVASGMASVLGPLLNSIITPLSGMLSLIGVFLGSMLTPALSLLSGVVKILAQGFVWFYNNALVKVQHGFIYLIESIVNFFINAINAVIHVMRKVGIRINKIGAFSLESQKMDEVSLSDVTDAGAASDVYAQNSTGSGASYTGSQTIIINIYQQAPLVGSSGMKEFAVILRSELDDLGYYGA